MKSINQATSWLDRTCHFQESKTEPCDPLQPRKNSGIERGIHGDSYGPEMIYVPLV